MRRPQRSELRGAVAGPLGDRFQTSPTRELVSLRLVDRIDGEPLVRTARLVPAVLETGAEECGAEGCGNYESSRYCGKGETWLMNM